MKRLLNQLIPFFFLGLVIVVFALGIILFSYLLLFGAIIGFILFGLAWLREKFFPRTLPRKTPKKPGRIIDSDDWKEL